MQTRNVAKAVRSRLGSALRRGRTAPAEAGVVAPKRRPRRLIILALAVLSVLPISVAVQTVDAPRAEAAVDDRYNWPNVAAWSAAFYFWYNNVHWPSTGVYNQQWTANNGQVTDGGGRYNDNDWQLRNWLYARGAQGTLTFREYDEYTRPWGTNRGPERYVYNQEYDVIFHTSDHYANFTPINFGRLPIPYFAPRVYCYEYGPGQSNPRRIVLQNLRSNPIEFTVRGVPGSGMDVVYRAQYEYWSNNDGRYYAGGSYWDQGYSIPAWPSFNIHNDPNSICGQFTGWWNGAWG